MREFSFLTDKNGKIIRYANGMPIPYDHFDQDPFDDDDRREMIEYCLRTGIDIPEADLTRNGFEEIDGEWRHPDSRSGGTEPE